MRFAALSTSYVSQNDSEKQNWIPAFAGMAMGDEAGAWSLDTPAGAGTRGERRAVLFM